MTYVNSFFIASYYLQTNLTSRAINSFRSEYTNVCNLSTQIENKNKEKTIEVIINLIR